MGDAEGRVSGSLLIMGLGVSLLYVLQRGYPLLVRGYLDYLKMPEYTYLFILTPLSVVLAIETLITRFRLLKPSLSTLMAALSLFLGSLFFYVLGGLDEVNGTQLYGISAVLLAASLTLMVMKPDSLKTFISFLLLLLITVPVPLSVISYSSTAFSQAVGIFVATIMGAEIFRSGSGLYISVYDPEGVRRVFELVRACSGIISVTSILAISPLIIRVIMKSSGSYLVKAAKAAAVIAVSAGIVFAGNALRVAMVIYYTKNYNYEQALEIFHQHPSFIYSALAVAAAFYLLERFAPATAKDKAAVSRGHPIVSRVRRTAALSLLAAAAVAFALVSLSPALTPSVAVAGPAQVTTLNTLVSKPGEVIFNGTGVEILVERPVPALTTLLGSSTVDLIVLKYNGTTYSGYVEVAESPARFHGWHVCLTMQGYTILRSWKEESGSVIVNYLLVRRGYEERLLGYSIYAVPFLLSNGTATAYVRVSLFANIKNDADIEQKAGELKLLLKLPASKEVGGGGTALSLDKIMVLRNVLLAANLIVISALIIDGVARLFRMRR